MISAIEYRRYREINQPIVGLAFNLGPLKTGRELNMDVKEICLLQRHLPQPEAKVIFKETGAQDNCATGKTSSPKDNSASEQTSRPSEAAYSPARP